MSSKSNFVANYEDIFHKFLLGLYDGPYEVATILSSLRQLIDQPFNEAVNVGLTHSFVGSVQSQLSASSHASLGQEIRAAIIKLEDSRDALGLGAFIDARFDIASSQNLTVGGQKDFIFSKINHGFWEQIYAIYSQQIIPEKMRIRDPEPYIKMYVDSDFIRPLFSLLRNHYSLPKIGRSELGVHFAVSLLNGMYWHNEVLDDDHTPIHKLVVPGAAIGVSAFFAPLLNDQKLFAEDGAFPKRGWLSGQLEGIIKRLQLISDECIFVVPPHLKRIKLGRYEFPHSTLLVSGTKVHEGWLASLYLTAFDILAKLTEGRNLLVFTQSGVFSGMLGLFLAQAKAELGITNSRLHFFDLGQVLDIANTQDHGPWQRNYDIKSDGLFILS